MICSNVLKFIAIYNCTHRKFQYIPQNRLIISYYMFSVMKQS